MDASTRFRYTWAIVDAPCDESSAVQPMGLLPDGPELPAAETLVEENTCWDALEAAEGFATPPPAISSGARIGCPRSERELCVAMPKRLQSGSKETEGLYHMLPLVPRTAQLRLSEAKHRATHQTHHARSCCGPLTPIPETCHT